MVGKLTLAFEDQLLRDAFYRVAISWKLEKAAALGRERA
jgi:hypothetical protein